MLLLRWAFALPLLVALGFGLAFLLTRDGRWLRRGLKVFAWTLGAVLLFFVVLFLEQFARSG